eukprot:9429797-Pyramimonas_sp.AAC.1
MRPRRCSSGGNSTCDIPPGGAGKYKHDSMIHAVDITVAASLTTQRARSAVISTEPQGEMQLTSSPSTLQCKKHWPKSRPSPQSYATTSDMCTALEFT